ncbi:MAG: exonuclease domain-containing protein [Thermoleophilia bacterium]
MSRYAVIDIETTGFSPAHRHRILEIGVVLVDDDGNLVHEWETLVNPQRDVAATEIHGLSAADVYTAPTFEQIAGELESLLRGRVPVAHNLAFDAPFVAAEYGRLGYEVPLSPTSGLCTMRLASRYLQNGPRSLAACCGLIGCPVECVHAALDDARAAARLLAHYMRADDAFADSWLEVITAAETSVWPAMPAGRAARVSRTTAKAAQEQHFLGRLAPRAPRSEMHPGANSYLSLLDRALLDRQISRHEGDELVAAAEMMGLAREDAIALHRLYVRALGKLALEDGVVSAGERADLELVAEMLGLGAGDVDASLDPASAPAADVCDVGGFGLKPGDAVVFTGDAPGVDRAELEYQARALGLRVTGSVSGKTSLVVAADPDSISGKARKARDLGVPIVDYAAYMGLLDSVTCRPAVG